MALVSPVSPVDPSNIRAVARLLLEVASAGDTFSTADDAALAPRLELLAKARELVHALETRREIMIQHLWAQASREYSVKERLS